MLFAFIFVFVFVLSCCCFVSSVSSISSVSSVPFVCCCCWLRRGLKRAMCHPPSDPATPEPSTKHSCESSWAPKKICPQRKKSLSCERWHTKLNCLADHASRTYGKSARSRKNSIDCSALPLGKRVDQKEDGTHKHRSPLSNQKKPISPHVGSHEKRTKKKTALARTTLPSKQQEEASRTQCRFPRSLHLQAICCRLCHNDGKDSAVEVRVAPEAPSNSLCFRQCPSGYHRQLPDSNFCQNGPCAVSIRTQTSSLASTHSVGAIR